MSCIDPFSELNRQISQSPLVERPDPDEFSLFYQILNAVEAVRYQPDTLEDVTVFEAVVYEVLEPDPIGVFLNQAAIFLEDTFSRFLEECTKPGSENVNGEIFTAYRVYIPGLTPLADSLPPIPDMNQIPDNGNPVNAIELYGDKYPIIKALPLATHHTEGLEKANIGDIVKVGFLNIKKLDAAYYMGKSEGTGKIFTVQSGFGGGGGRDCINIIPSSKVTSRKEKENFKNFADDDIRVPYSFRECLVKKTNQKLTRLNRELDQRGIRPSKCTKTMPRPSNNPEVEGFKQASTTFKIVPAEKYKENRVRLDSFAPATEKDKNMVRIPKDLCFRGQNIYAHTLVIPRLIAMNEAWLSDYPVGTTIDKVKEPDETESYFIDEEGNEWKGERIRQDGNLTKPNGDKLHRRLGAKEIIKGPSEGIKVVSGLRKVREDKFGSREAYEKILIKRYGTIEAGQLYLAWDSPHGTGLALDFKCNGISTRVANNRYYEKTTFWNWLKDNAHRFGFTPYKAESWHWEVLVPRDNWYSGEEFVQNSNGNDRYAWRVVEIGTRNGTPTTSRQFHKKEITDNTVSRGSGGRGRRRRNAAPVRVNSADPLTGEQRPIDAFGYAYAPEDGTDNSGGTSQADQLEGGMSVADPLAGGMSQTDPFGYSDYGYEIL